MFLLKHVEQGIVIILGKKTFRCGLETIGEVMKMFEIPQHSILPSIYAVRANYVHQFHWQMFPSSIYVIIFVGNVCWKHFKDS